MFFSNLVFLCIDHQKSHPMAVLAKSPKMTQCLSNSDGSIQSKISFIAAKVKKTIAAIFGYQVAGRGDAPRNEFISSLSPIQELCYHS